MTRKPKDDQIAAGVATVEARYLRTADAAKYLGIPRKTLEHWRATLTVKLPFIRVSPGVIVYDRAELDEFMAARRVEGPH